MSAPRIGIPVNFEAMNPRSLLMLAHLLPLAGATQIWCPPGATWTYEALNDNGGFIRMTYRADTIIDGMEAQVIDRYSATQSAPDFGVPTYAYEPVARITRVQDDIVFTYANSTWDTLYWFGATPAHSYRAPHTTCSPFIIVDTGTDTLSGMPLDWYNIGSVHRIYQRLGYVWHVELTCPGSILLDPANLRCYSDNEISVQLLTTDCEALVGIEDLAPTSPIRPFPNPGSDRIYLPDDPRTERLILHDGLGREVLQVQLRGQSVVDMSALQAGPYTYRLVGADGREMSRGVWMKE